jgi:hypothetical protein
MTYNFRTLISVRPILALSSIVFHFLLISTAQTSLTCKYAVLAPVSLLLYGRSIKVSVYSMNAGDFILNKSNITEKKFILLLANNSTRLGYIPFNYNLALSR